MRVLALGLVLLGGCRQADRAAAGASVSVKEDATATATATASASASADASVDATLSMDASIDGAASAVVDARPDWCIEGMLGLDEDACYVRPEGRATRLLVYLHGIVPPTKDSVQKRTVEGAVIAAARRASAFAVVPRGRRGIGPGSARDWWAWPTSPATHARLVKEIVARWVVMKKTLEAVNGAPFEKTYLAGSSNGAYFLAALALRGDCDALGFPIDGYGAMSGGATGGRGMGALEGRGPQPVYVGFGSYDGSTKNGAKALAAVFQAARWPVEIAEHPFGHGAREIYIDEAFAFWDR